MKKTRNGLVVPEDYSALQQMLKERHMQRQIDDLTNRVRELERLVQR